MRLLYNSAILTRVHPSKHLLGHGADQFQSEPAFALRPIAEEVRRQRLVSTHFAALLGNSSYVRWKMRKKNPER
jgi:hypothetical protein